MGLGFEVRLELSGDYLLTGFRGFWGLGLAI